MKRVLIIICLLYSFTANGQDTCFGNCLENLEHSTLPVPERNNQILQGLVGCRAPNFIVKTIDGETLTLEQLQGKVVVINFWFESCAPCIAELPALNRLWEEYKSKDVVFIAFGRDDSESIKDFLKRRDFHYLQVSSDYDITQEYCILAGWPTNMVLDKEGILRKIFSGGYLDERAKIEAYNQMQPIVEEYLNK